MYILSYRIWINLWKVSVRKHFSPKAANPKRPVRTVSSSFFLQLVSADMGASPKACGQEVQLSGSGAWFRWHPRALGKTHIAKTKKRYQVEVLIKFKLRVLIS